MLKKFVYGGICILFAVIGILLVIAFLQPWFTIYPAFRWPVLVGTGVVLALGGLFVAPALVRKVEKTTERLVARVAAMSTSDIVGCVIGLIVGLVIAALIGTAVGQINIVGPYLAILAALLFGYVGLMVGYRKSLDIWQIFSRDKAEKKERITAHHKNKAVIPPKILDTSVIIDGRIADICQTGFIEGNLVVPHFVLEELRHIADSSDYLRRNRGRGGLDVLNRMQQELAEHVIISDTDYPQIAEVDSKLLKLAQDLKGVVVTNDFNLNKVAQLQGVKVLNINELSNAVKPVLLPGEEMIAQVIKEGKESDQGVAYLDDGTMIVIESGRRYIGQHIPVVVTSILQTAAGRMVFAKPKSDKNDDLTNQEEAI